MLRDIPPILTETFPPSPDALLDCARRNVDDEMLMDVANADYGYRAEEMFRWLRTIRDDGQIPRPVDGWLSEVLELTRNSDPDKPKPTPFEPGPTGLRGHRTRLFACAALLRATTEPNSGYSDCCEDFTLAQCLASAKLLEDEISNSIGRYLTWRFTRKSLYPPDPPLFALGLVSVASRRSAGERALACAAEWSLAIEGDECRGGPAAFSIQTGVWTGLAVELETRAAQIDDDALRTNLRLCTLMAGPV